MNLTRALAALLVASAAFACSSSDSANGTHGTDAAPTGDAAPPGSDAGSGDADVDAGPPALVRFFDDFRPTLLHPEYCFGVGDRWIGPLYAGNYELNGYSWGGFQGLSPYASVAPGTYMLRVIAQYADTCDARIDGFPDIPLPGPIASGRAYTVTVSGDYQSDAGQAPLARMFVDEIAPDDAPGRLRVINLAEKQGTLDLARINVNTPPGSDAQKPVPLFLGVKVGEFGKAPATGGAAGTSDTNGYVTLPDDFYFYYNFPVYPEGGDVNHPMMNLKYTDPATLKGNWTLFFVSRPDGDPKYDGSLAPSLCRDNGALGSSKCQ